VLRHIDENFHKLSQLEQSTIEIAKTREGLVANACEQPTLRDLNADFNLGLVPGRHRSRRQDRGAVVATELSGGALHGRVVATRLDHSALELVGDDRVRHAAKERERAGDTRYEVRDLLRPRCFRVGVVARAENSDEQLDLDDFASDRVDKLRFHAGVVDEQLVNRDVYLTHHRRLPLQPLTVSLAERRVTQPLRLLREVLDVQQGERYCAPSKLQMDHRAVGLWANTRQCRWRIQTRRELGVGHRFDRGRIDAERPGVAIDAVYFASADADGSSNLPVRPPEAELVAKDLSENVHG
jgi:hypothetical protein